MPHFYPFQKAAEARERARCKNKRLMLRAAAILLAVTAGACAATLLRTAPSAPAPDATSQQGD